MATTFSSIYLNRLSGQFLVGLFTGVAAVSEVPMMHWSERIMRRLGGPQTLVLAYLLLAGSYLGLALITEPAVLLGIALLRGLGFGLLAPTVVRLVAGWAPPGRAATYQALLNAVLWGLAPLIAGPLGGVITTPPGRGSSSWRPRRRRASPGWSSPSPNSAGSSRRRLIRPAHDSRPAAIDFHLLIE